MLGVLLALLTSVSYAVGAIFARLGLEQIKPSLGTLITMISNFLLVAVLALIFNYQDLLAISKAAAMLFLLVGVLEFPVARLLKFLCIAYVGVVRAHPVVASAPLFAVVIAVVFTGEKLTLSLLGGVVAIVGGVYLIVSER